MRHAPFSPRARLFHQANVTRLSSSDIRSMLASVSNAPEFQRVPKSNAPEFQRRHTPQAAASLPPWQGTSSSSSSSSALYPSALLGTRGIPTTGAMSTRAAGPPRWQPPTRATRSGNRSGNLAGYAGVAGVAGVAGARLPAGRAGGAVGVEPSGASLYGSLLHSSGRGGVSVSSHGLKARRALASSSPAVGTVSSQLPSQLQRRSAVPPLTALSLTAASRNDFRPPPRLLPSRASMGTIAMAAERAVREAKAMESRRWRSRLPSSARRPARAARAGAGLTAGPRPRALISTSALFR